MSDTKQSEGESRMRLCAYCDSREGAWSAEGLTVRRFLCKCGETSEFWGDEAWMNVIGPNKTDADTERAPLPEWPHGDAHSMTCAIRRQRFPMRRLPCDCKETRTTQNTPHSTVASVKNPAEEQPE